MDRSYHSRLIYLIVSATVAMLAVSSVALHIVHQAVGAEAQVWLILPTSTAATLLVMGALHSELQRLYKAKSDSELKAKDDARRDSLTGIGNRKLIIEHLNRVCAADADAAAQALLLIDLNNFKRVNDTLGHQIGDELLAAVAARLSKRIPDGTLGRLGGDEFAIIVRADEEAELEGLCGAVSMVFDEPFSLSSGDCFAGGCVGATMIQRSGSASANLRRADLALYEAKRSGLDFRVYDEAMSKLHHRSARLTRDLRDSLSNGEGLFAELQPIVSSSGQFEALEAFLRWRHPELGLIRPLEIVSVAESSQQIDACERFVAREVFKAAKRFPRMQICLNVSGLQLLDEQFPAWLERTARAEGVSPSQLIVEVSEKTISERLPQMAEGFEYLSRMGCRIAIDNYGQGLTSLSDLGRRGVSVVKVDREALLEAQRLGNLSILRASVDLARAHKMTVVATGVDTPQLKQLAAQAAFDWLQGFQIGRPSELSQLEISRSAA